MRIFQGWKLRRIFVISSGIVLLAIGVLMAMTLVQLFRIENLLQAKQKSALASEKVLRAQFFTSQVQQFWTDASLTASTDAIQEAEASHETLLKNLQDLAELKPSLKSDLQTLGELSKTLSLTGREMFHAYVRDGKRAGDLIMQRPQTGLDALSESLAAKMEGTIEKISTENQLDGTRLQESLKAVELSTAFFTVLVAATSLLTLFLMLKRITTLGQVSDILRKKMEELSSTAASVFSVSQEISQSSTQQAEAVQETAASIDEISAMVEQSTQNAAKSETESAQAREIAEKGQALVREMVAAVSHIQSTTQQIESAVATSHAKFREVSQIISEIGTKAGVINDIVFQTKLLSFNASVEAARSGEHGKGFAVVAVEVGNLAQMSGQAANEISQLLNQSTEKVENLISESKTSVEDGLNLSRKAVETGMRVAEDCSKALSQIVEISQHVSVNVADISQASREQTLGVSEVSKALRQIDSASHANVNTSKSAYDSAEQLAARLQDLQNAASLLSGVVDGFAKPQNFVWTENFNTQVKAMDEEHKNIVSQMNRLFDAIGTGHVPTIRSNFNSLAEIATAHFSHEERYFDSIDYKFSAEHKRIHKALLEKVIAFGSQIGTPHFDGIALSAFLRDWLMRHILTVDKGYSRSQISQTSRTSNLAASEKRTA